MSKKSCREGAVGSAFKLSNFEEPYAGINCLKNRLVCMSPRLKLTLRQGWREAKNPGGPATYVRETSRASGYLQLSFATYKPGSVPDTEEATLLNICAKMASKVRGSNVVSKQSGKCNFGKFGTVTTQGEEPVYFRVWVISDSHHFILVTYTCGNNPDPQEVAEANEIALSTKLE